MPVTSDLIVERARIPPFAHQLVGSQMVIDQPYCLLADEMGAGKTKQVIDAAQAMCEAGVIDRVIVVAPASVRDVWCDEELGELAKHLWMTVPSEVTRYHAKTTTWFWQSSPPQRVKLVWIITNYEFIRSSDRLKVLLASCTPKTLLVLDESSAVKSRAALQTKACMQLRHKCGRVVLLNGTPIANNPMDMLSQGNLMHPSILQCPYITLYRDRYAVMANHNRFPQIIGWKNLDDLQRRFAPYVLRRLKKDCLDLPPKLDPVTLTATLTEKTWAVYKQMRDEMVAELENGTLSLASQAMVKAIRLAQITSGFLGGVESGFGDTRPEWVPAVNSITSSAHQSPVQELGQEKLDVFLSWLDDQFASDPHAKILVWCRFRAELSRVLRTLIHSQKADPTWLGTIHGGQSHDERDHALHLLDPRTAPNGPAIVLGTPASGSMGLNLTAASVVVYLSNDYSLKTRLQSEDRVHRPGQTRAVSYYDIIAQGPKGQRTIDHAVIKALRAKHELATWTTNAWLQALKDE